MTLNRVFQNARVFGARHKKTNQGMHAISVENVGELI